MRRFAALRRRADFAWLRRRGRRTVTPLFTIYRGRGKPGPRPLVGISVSSKVGPAVRRNLVKRRIAAAMQVLPLADPSERLLVVARPETAGAPFCAILEELERSL